MSDSKPADDPRRPPDSWVTVLQQSWHPGRLAECVRELFPLKPAGLIKHLDLLRPIYRATAAHGHFGRDQFTWEKTDMARKIREYLE